MVGPTRQHQVPDGLIITSSYNEQSVQWMARQLGAAMRDRVGRRYRTSIISSRSYAVTRAAGAAASVAGKLGRHSSSTQFMYGHKVMFDKCAAQSIRDLPRLEMIVGMWGSSQHIFQSANSNVLRVLNFVNAHPKHHNGVLRAVGIPAHHHEMVPRWFAPRIDAELALADLVIVPSRQVALDLISAHSISRAKLVVSPYGVDLDRFRPTSSRTPTRRANVLYVGQMSHRKGVTAILEAARRRPSIDFRLIGPVVSHEVLAGCPANVSVSSRVAHSQLATLYAGFDILLLPSREDTFGLVVLEALASGLPVGVSRCAGSSEIVDAECGWIMEPASANDIVAVLDDLPSSSDGRDELRAAARHRAEQFSWNRFNDVVAQNIIQQIERKSTST